MTSKDLGQLVNDTKDSILHRVYTCLGITVLKIQVKYLKKNTSHKYKPKIEVGLPMFTEKDYTTEDKMLHALH